MQNLKQLDEHVQHAKHIYEESVTALIRCYENFTYHHGGQRQEAHDLMDKIDKAESANIFMKHPKNKWYKAQ